MRQQYRPMYLRSVAVALVLGAGLAVAGQSCGRNGPSATTRLSSLRKVIVQKQCDCGPDFAIALSPDEVDRVRSKAIAVLEMEAGRHVDHGQLLARKFFVWADEEPGMRSSPDLLVIDAAVQEECPEVVAALEIRAVAEHARRETQGGQVHSDLNTEGVAIKGLWDDFRKAVDPELVDVWSSKGREGLTEAIHVIDMSSEKLEWDKVGRRFRAGKGGSEVLKRVYRPESPDY